MSTPIQKLFDLTGQTALVTGGSRGLGLQIAEALGEAGAKVMLTSRKAADLEEAAAHLQAKGIDTRWIAADVSQPSEIARVVDEAMQRMGHIDVIKSSSWPCTVATSSLYRGPSPCRRTVQYWFCRR